MPHLAAAAAHLAHATEAELATISEVDLARAEKALWRWYVAVRRHRRRLSGFKSADAIIEEARAATLPRFRGGAGEHSQ